MRALFTLLLCITAAIGGMQVQAQSAPLSFRNGALVSGTGKTAGAEYHFNNVLPNINARVRIDSLVGGATVRTLDTTGIGYDDAFQPVINSLAGGNSYAVFTVSLLQTNGNPHTLPSLSTTGMDVDGNTNLKEWVQFDLGGGTARLYSDSTEISIDARSTGYRGINAAGKEATGIDTSGFDVMFTVTHNNVSSFTIRFGADLSGTGSSTRNFSAYMKDFVGPGGNTLPLTLTSFKVNAAPPGALLSWQTADETNTAYFVVERSLDGVKFGAVAWVQAAGFSSQQRQYQYRDDLCLLDADRVFYQLRFVDRDSLFRFSRVQSVQFAATPADPVLFPNPASGPVSLRLPPEWQSRPLAISLHDAAGRLLRAETRTQPAPSEPVNLASLPRGTYWIQLRSGAMKKSLALVKP